MKGRFRSFLKRLPVMRLVLEDSPAIQTEPEEVNRSPEFHIRKPKETQVMCTPKAMISARSPEVAPAVPSKINPKDIFRDYEKPLLHRTLDDNYKAAERAAQEFDVERLGRSAETYGMRPLPPYPKTPPVPKKVDEVEKANEVTRRIVGSISKRLMMTSHQDIGGVLVNGIAIYRRIENDDEVLKIRITQPDGKMKVFQGPVYAFRGCNNIREFVLRALEHGKDV